MQDEQMAEVSADTVELGVINESPSITPPISDTPLTISNGTDADTSASTNATPIRSGTPTGTVLVPGPEVPVGKAEVVNCMSVSVYRISSANLHPSASRSMGIMPPRIRQVSTVQESQVLRKRV
jgi:hypothetical protein